MKHSIGYHSFSWGRMLRKISLKNIPKIEGIDLEQTMEGHKILGSAPRLEKFTIACHMVKFGRSAQYIYYTQ